ncbi:hypothetical protein Tsubulata_033646 [Turnera subulata]|uniref:Glycosyltransferase n=1 Tax=Turnera subulata TaxID=218843 RepID=A0A9Q0FY03_9ROSI|nr:hypothetical protein Tsubulata_033646 [Turnera subulata]
MAQGHMIPMMDIGKLLAQQGMMVTIITTPLNAQRYATTIAHSKESGLKIQVLEIHFPCQEVGLPNNCENLDMMPSLSLGTEFFVATYTLQEPVISLFEQLSPTPDCIISDMSLPFTSEVAKKFGIPRISFNGFSAFALLCVYKLRVHKILETIVSESEPFVVPDIPDHITLTKKQLPSAMTEMKEFGLLVGAAEMNNYGFIINSFEELETTYIQEFIKARGCKVWCIGPVSLCNKENLDKVHRGNKASIEESECLNWLNSHQPGSVIYACLGSLCNMTSSQLIELGLGLEESSRPFIWVIRNWEISKGLNEWLVEDGFEERNKGTGLLIRGWAPQLTILSHPAIGGFLTHCGWNSILEGICAGVPMVTWPLFGDQFCNEKLVVEILKIGVSVGSEVTIRWGEEEKIGVLVNKEDVTKAIDGLMNKGVESEERIKRVQELSKMAKKATTEEGSSYFNLKQLIEDIMQQAC